MNKKEVRKRVLQNGKPLDLSKFSWDEKTRTFYSLEKGLVIDFLWIDDCTFTTGSNCTFKTGSNCTFTTGEYCIFKTGEYCIFKTDSSCTFTTGEYCIFKTDSSCTFTTDSSCTFKTDSSCTFMTGSNCTFMTGSNCTFMTGSNCTFKTGSNCTFTTDFFCTFTTGSYCTFTTGSYCTFTTGSYCTFTTDSYCIFTTDSSCTFTTGSNCTFTTGEYCIFTTGEDCAIIRHDIFEVIQPIMGQMIQICPYDIKGYLTSEDKGKTWYMDGKQHIIRDGIFSQVISQKGDVYKVLNHGDEEESFLVVDGEYASHGATLREAMDDLVFKRKDKDTSAYVGMTLDSKLSLEDMVKCYRTITGACSNGVRGFMGSLTEKKSEYTVSEVVVLTEGKYGNYKFKSFFVK